MKSFFNVKVLAVLFIFSFIFTNLAFAQEEKKSRSNDSWLLFGFGYTVPSDDKVDGLMGPATLTIGGDIWRFIGLEVTLGSRWRLGEDKIPFAGQEVTLTNALWSFDIKPYLILQPKFGIDLISIRPYFGIGPTFSFSGFTYTSDLVGSSSLSDTSFDVGFSTKLGVRLQALKFLFVGVGAEYMYQKPSYNGIEQNLSGFSFGGEIGLIW